MKTPAAPTARLVVLTPASDRTKASYTADEGKLRVLFDNIVMDRWEAYDPEAMAVEIKAAAAEKRDSRDRAYTVACGYTLNNLKANLGRYLADKTAGTLGANGRTYGV